jgi:uncharacterized membrane protein YgcG
VSSKKILSGTVVASALGLSALVFVATPASASSDPSARYGVINVTVDAATDHEIGTSSAFPNFTNGAVDNYYSMAHSHIDNSPFAQGTASPADSGPIGQTGAAQAGQQQPQYADARWPGAKQGRTASFGNSGGPSAYATASFYKATALSTEASDAGAPAGTMKIAAPKAVERRLRIAIAAWKEIWMSRLRIPNFADNPLPIPTVTIPTVPVPTLPTTTSRTTTTSPTTTSSGGGGGGGGGSAPANGGFVSQSVARLDPKSRAVLASGESSMGTVNIAAGQIVLKHVNVKVTIKNTGRAKGTVTDSVGGATVGGVPVTIDQHGVHVAGQGSGLPFGQADDALNTALKNAGVEIYTVSPEVKKSTNELAITATGVHVAFVQPVNQSGVPSQTVDHIIGDVFIDSLAAPAPPLPKLPLGNSGSGSSPSVGNGGSTGGSGGGTSSFGSGSGSSSTGTGSSSTGAPSPASFLTEMLSKPWWLLAAYLVWQAIVIATGASLWRLRAAGAVT